jgi:hypothetical protein
MEIVDAMSDANYLLAELLTLAALIAGTIEYCEIIRRRTVHRALETESRIAQEAGLHGLVRVLLVDR